MRRCELGQPIWTKKKYFHIVNLEIHCMQTLCYLFSSHPTDDSNKTSERIYITAHYKIPQAVAKYLKSIIFIVQHKKVEI